MMVGGGGGVSVDDDWWRGGGIVGGDPLKQFSKELRSDDDDDDDARTEKATEKATEHHEEVCEEEKKNEVAIVVLTTEGHKLQRIVFVIKGSRVLGFQNQDMFHSLSLFPSLRCVCIFHSHTPDGFSDPPPSARPQSRASPPTLSPRDGVPSSTAFCSTDTFGGV